MTARAERIVLRPSSAALSPQWSICRTSRLGPSGSVPSSRARIASVKLMKPSFSVGPPFSSTVRRMLPVTVSMPPAMAIVAARGRFSASQASVSSTEVVVVLTVALWSGGCP